MKQTVVALLVVLMLSSCASNGSLKRVPPKSPISSTSSAVETSSSDTSSTDQSSSFADKAKSRKLRADRPRSLDIPGLKTSDINPNKNSATKASSTSGEKKDVQIEADKMPLAEFIHLLFGKILETDYYVDKSIQGRPETVTLNITTPLGRTEAFSVCSEVLKGYGLQIQKKGKVYFINPSNVPNEKAAMPYFVGTVPEDFSSNEMVGLFAEIDFLKQGQYELALRTLALSPEGSCVPMPNTNFLFVNDHASNARSAAQVLRTLDRPSIVDKKLRMFYIDFLKVDAFQAQLTDIMAAQGIPIAKDPNGLGLVLVPLPQIRALLAVSPKREWLDLISSWQQRLDVASVLGDQPQYFIYYAKNRRASDLVKLLGLTASGVEPDTRGEGSNKASGKLPGQTATWQRSTDAMGGAKDTKTQQPVDVQAPGSEQSSVLNSKPKVIVDEATNSLVITAVPSEYEKIKNLLSELDRLPRQVLVEVTIAEVTLKDDLQYGIEWAFKHNGDFNGTISTLGGLGIGKSGFLYTVASAGKNFQAVINAFANKNLLHVISTPRLVVLDNEEATINVGQDVPIITSQATAADLASSSTNNPSILQSIQYRSTGVILHVKPTINSGGMLTINVSQEVSDAQTNTVSTISSPIILNRNVATKVALKSGSSVLLGGMIKESDSGTVSRVPGVSKVPLLGELFKNNSTSKNRTELFVQITPHILTSPEDAENATQRFKGLIDVFGDKER